MSVDNEDAPSGVVLWVSGIPRPQPRPRFLGKAVVSTTGSAQRWARMVEREARIAVRNLGGADQVKEILGELIRVRLEFWLPKRSRGDVDNYAKLCIDQLMKAGALGGDDRRVVELKVEKKHTDRARGVSIGIYPALDAPSGAQEAAGEPRPGWLVPEGDRKPGAL